MSTLAGCAGKHVVRVTFIPRSYHSLPADAEDRQVAEVGGLHRLVVLALDEQDRIAFFVELSLERCMGADTAALRRARKIEHPELSILDAMVPQPLLGLGPVLFKPAGDQVPH